ncbi:hypothetical protein [Campylobacter sp. RM16189]|uniref:hypothetical protein n=1 Tax=Campylobacter sp. RM16189 TaxID=1705726 RepID=UPI0014753707|nr:hypothetical protein [Campylobacter sp. RM16189]
MKKVTFVINDDEDWELFRIITKENNSDASKEIRKFISWYLAQHRDLCEKIRSELESEKV